MRIPLRTKVTLTLVAFGLIPAGIVAAFAYMSAQDYMSRQTLMISAAAASISDHARMLVFKNNEADRKGEKAAAESPCPSGGSFLNPTGKICRCGSPTV